MSLALADTAPEARAMRVSLALWIGFAVYAVLIAGNWMLNDPDTMWHVAIGQWMLDHRAVPDTDVYSFTKHGEPWPSMYWVSQLLYAKAYSTFGWAGPVTLAAGASAVTFGLLAKLLSRHFNKTATIVFVVVAFVLTAPHLLVRPHVLAFPVMVFWISGLVDAADRHDAPPFWLLSLIAVWANLHGGFIFGLMMVGPIALDAVVQAQADKRVTLVMRWALFGVLALAASCVTPYGLSTLIEPMKILMLGKALSLVTEFLPIDFGHLGAFEICMLLAIGFTLLRGITLPPTRILLLLGLLHMALSQSRATEMLVLLAPLILAAPLSRQIGAPDIDQSSPEPLRHVIMAGVVVVIAAVTLSFVAAPRFAPDTANAPVQAVAELKKLKVARVFNSYDFGGYLLASGVPTFIDGRTELYGEKFFVDHVNATMLTEPENLFRLLRDYQIEATLIRTESPANKLLDHVDGWQRIYSDNIATVYLRKAGALHTGEPVVDPQKQ